ncbi:hypothetical protein Pint_17688 [Pistacia integerrima]|uniref:Uncharacterized protein n=1 Tax=Pistacia integerrima TaxID=434235 RepID=A0ACC0YT98_9ROSI|nr:hypothetical protein Pint_17688 [Pistacia integerrima]
MLEMPCRILMDLVGPKIRTGSLKPGPCVTKISLKKNATGNVILPAQVWLSYKEAGPPPSHLSPDAALFIDDQRFLSELKEGFVAECTRTAYVKSGKELYTKGKKGRLLTGKEDLSGPASLGHRITCSSGYLLDSIKPGEPIAFDDGKIWGVIQGASNSEIVVSITRAGLRGSHGSGICCSHADIVGVSFVRDMSDIVELRQELEKRKLQNLGALAVECGWERLADIQEEILSICGAAHLPVIWATQVLESLVKSGVPTRAEITNVVNGRR